MFDRDVICDFEYNSVNGVGVTCEISNKGCNVFINKKVAHPRRKGTFTYPSVCGILFNNSKENLNWVLDNLDKLVDTAYDLEESLGRIILEDGEVQFSFKEAVHISKGATDCFDPAALNEFSTEYQEKNNCKIMVLSRTLNRKRFGGKCIKECLLYSCDTEDNQKILVCEKDGIREATKEDIDKYLVKGLAYV